jgi:TonB family protein
MSHPIRSQCTVSLQRVAASTLFVLSAAVATAQAQQNGQVYAAVDLTTPPLIESMERAARVIQESYPKVLESRGIGGTVLLQFVVEADGSVNRASVKVVAATINRLGEAAKAVIHNVRFTPGTLDGTPVRTEIQFPVEYRAGRG